MCLRLWQRCEELQIKWQGECPSTLWFRKLALTPAVAPPAKPVYNESKKGLDSTLERALVWHTSLSPRFFTGVASSRSHSSPGNRWRQSCRDIREASPWLVEGIFLDRFTPGEVRNHPPVGKDYLVSLKVVVANSWYAAELTTRGSNSLSCGVLEPGFAKTPRNG